MSNEEPGEDVPVVTGGAKEPGEDVPVVTGGAKEPGEDALAGGGGASVETLQKSLEQERQNALECQDRLKLALADFENLSKKTQSDIENGISAKFNEFMVEFLKIHDDFERAGQALHEQNIDRGLGSILKNMDSLLAKYGVRQIDALGEIFDPNLHEAISVTHDPGLDEGTITKEIRKGYISHNRVIRPTLVEISKRTEGVS